MDNEGIRTAAELFRENQSLLAALKANLPRCHCGEIATWLAVDWDGVSIHFCDKHGQVDDRFNFKYGPVINDEVVKARDLINKIEGK